MLRKIAKLLLTATLTVSMLAPSATVVFADSEETVDATDENAEEDFPEDILAEEYGEDALDILAANKHKAKVTTKGLEATGEKASALMVSATDGSMADVTVNGSATGNSDSGAGAYVYSTSNAEVELTITENTSGNTGSSINVTDGAFAQVTIEGGSSGGFEESSTGLFINVEDVENSGQGDAALADVTVKGDTIGGFAGTQIENEGGNVAAIVEGDSASIGDGYDTYGLKVGTSQNGLSDVFVGGDVQSAGTGLVTSAASGGTNIVVVEGTVYGGKVGVNINDNGSQDSSVTVWKVETDKGGVIAGSVDAAGNVAKDASAEKKIQYIIKVDQPKGATLTATDANGKALATVTAINGKTFEYAHQGDKVLLKVDVDKDYTLDAVYGDKGQQYKLVKDASGNYYIEVPAGGGVYFSAVLSKKEKEKEEEKEDKAKKAADTSYLPVANAAAQAAITSIVATPAGGTANIAFTGTFIDASVVRMLLARRDINVSLACFVNGKLCVIMIPAGADLSDLIKPDGTIDIEKLAKKFGKTEVK